jgi:uncharacterized membrane protein YgcG
VNKTTFVLLSVALWICALPALAATPEQYALPTIGGHVTDPTHLLSTVDRDSLEHQLGDIQRETQVDVAAFLAPVSAEMLPTIGREAYRQWNIGRDWENGVLVVLSSKAAECRVILADDGAPLRPVVVAQIEANASRTAHEGNFRSALQAAGERIAAELREREKRPLARAPGHKARTASLGYASGALLVVVFAIYASWQKRTLWPRQ